MKSNNMKVIGKNTLNLFLVATFLSGCCSIKMKFSEDELKWLNVYNVGDTIVFQSQNGEYDTIYITDKKIYHSECNPIVSHGIYLPILGDIHYSDGSNGTRKLIGLVKNHERTSMFINLHSGSNFFIDINKEVVKSLNEKDLFVFDTTRPGGKLSSPGAIYWHEKYGIVKYITHGGVEWKRINLIY
jgi:hypothetical protein